MATLLRELAIRVTADSSSYQREMNRASRLGFDYYKTMEERSRRFDSYIANNNRSIQAMNMQLSQLKSSALSVAGAFAGGFAFTNVVNMADDWGQLAVRVKMAVESVNGSANDYERVQDRLLTISNRNAKAIEDSQELYIATASSMKDLGYSIDETVDFIEAMSNSYTLNATSAEKVKTSIDTINKSMITGTITNKQWTQLMSSTSNISSALADSLKKEEKVIKDLGVNGQISMRQLVDAMIKVKDETGELADAMGYTGKDGVTILSNSFKHLVGEFNRSHGITKSLANALIVVADNINLIGVAGAAFVGIGLSRYIGGVYTSFKTATAEIIHNTNETRGNALAQKHLAEAELQKIAVEKQSIATSKQALIVRAQNVASIRAGMHVRQAILKLEAQEIALTEKEIQAKNRLTVANRQATLSGSGLSLLSRTGSGLLGLLGGPVGLATTLLSVGAAFMMFGGTAEEAKKPLEELQLPVDQLIAKFKELDKSRQLVIKTEIETEIKTNEKDVADNASDIKNKLREAMKKVVVDDSGSYPKVSQVLFDTDEKAIEEYANEFDSLTKKIGNGKDGSKAFGEQLHVINQKLISAVGGGEQFEKTLTNMTRGILDNTEKLAENKEKLDAIKKASEETETGIKKLDVADFPNLENQLGVLSQQLEVNKLKANKNGEAAYVLAGLQRAAGDAALEHAADLIALAKGADLSGKMTDDLAKKIKELSEKLRENYKEQEKSKHTKTSKSADELYKSQLDRLNSQINAYTDITELQKIRRQLSSGELSKLSEKYAKTLELKATELDRLNAQKEYKSILDSLRSPAEQQLDAYKEQLSIIDKANLSLQQRKELLEKISKKSVESAPSFSYQNSYNGLGSDLLNVAEDEKKLHDWNEQQLQIQNELLSQKLINQQEYADAIVNIEDTMKKKQQDIQSAYTLATLSTFSSLTGSIAEMFKETAGESSAAYKVMFLASKASAIAQATISTFVAANKARELGEPYGEIMANTVMGLGMANVGMIAAQTISGMAHSGIDNIPKEGTWLLDKGERVVDARTNADLKDFLQTSNNLQASNKSGGNITVNVPVTISNDNLSAEDGKQLGTMIKQSVMSIIQEQQRPGGLLNKR